MVKSKPALMQRTRPRTMAASRVRKADVELVTYFVSVLMALAALALSASSTFWR